jgi:hypothetical protein
MNIDDKKINVNDISFDDMLDGGIENIAETAEESQPTEPIEDEVVEEQVQETSLEDDVEAKKQEDQKQGQVLAEAEIPVPEENKLTKATSDTEEKEKKEEGEEGEDTVVAQILSSLGYNSEHTYEDTSDGLIQLTKDVGSQMAEDQLDELFEKFPLVRQHLQYVMSGGQSQDFMAVNDPRGDYSKMKISEKDLRGQKYILSEYFKAKGHDDKFINELLVDYEESDKLYKKAETAQKELVNMQAQYKNNFMKQQQAYQKQQFEEQKKFWDGVYTTIDESQDFKGITVPQREKKKFFNYLSKPVTREGYTQRDVDYNDAAMDVKLAMDYLMFKGFNLDTLINTKARTKNTQTLKNRIKGHQETVKSARKASKTPNTAVDIEDLDLKLF